MPIYKNDSATERIEVLNGNNRRQTLAPGEQTETLQYYDITDLTKVSDLPYINPVAAYHDETFTSAGSSTVVLTDPFIAKVRVQKVSGSFDIYLQSASNSPPVLKDWTDGDYPVDIIIDGRADQIVVVANEAGNIQLVEIKSR